MQAKGSRQREAHEERRRRERPKGRSCRSASSWKWGVGRFTLALPASSKPMRHCPRSLQVVGPEADGPSCFASLVCRSRRRSEQRRRFSSPATAQDKGVRWTLRWGGVGRRGSKLARCARTSRSAARSPACGLRRLLRRDCLGRSLYFRRTDSIVLGSKIPLAKVGTRTAAGTWPSWARHDPSGRPLSSPDVAVLRYLGLNGPNSTDSARAHRHQQMRIHKTATMPGPPPRDLSAPSAPELQTSSAPDTWAGRTRIVFPAEILLDTRGAGKSTGTLCDFL